MELVNDFVVNSPITETWDTLTDLEKIAPCMPGAHLEGVDGDVYKGVVKIKVGPIQANIKGQAEFAEKDPVNHRAVLNAAGRDTGNKGNASAVITAHLEPVSDSSTKVTVSTDLKITGKLAQFGGRGAMQDISSKLMAEFVDNLHTLTETNGGHGAAADAEPGTASVGASAPQAPPRSSDEVLDLGRVAGPMILKRMLPLIGAALVVVLVLGWRRRRR